jgi:hypothetical protein
MEYRGCGKTLIYIGADHTNDPQSATFRLIQAAFRWRRIDLVVVEGVPAHAGKNPGGEDPRGFMKAAESVAGTQQDSEGFLAARLAVAAHAPVTGAEPRETEILPVLNARGFEAADMFAFYVLRFIPQWQRQGFIASSTDPALDGQIHKLAKWFVGTTGVSLESISRVNSFAGFKAWYESTNGISYKRGFREDGADSAPAKQVTSARKTNTISDIVSDAREKGIVSTFASALRDYDFVLIVYGASHYMADRPAIETGLGAPHELTLDLK